MQQETISLLDYDWTPLSDPANYAAVVRSAFGAGGASADEVAEHLMPPMARLEMAQLEITTFCNFSCRECSRTKEMAANTWQNLHMPLERYKAIVNKLPPTRRIYLQGTGEPSMHPHFYELVKSASDSDKFDSIHFNTNAHTHDDAYWQSLAGFKGITVALSVDSLDPDIATLCRAGTDTDLLWHRLVLFRDTFRWFIVAMVASRLNLHDIENTLRRIAALGKVRVQLTRVMSDDPEVVLQESDEAWLAERLDVIRQDFPDFTVFFNARASSSGPNLNRCVLPFLKPYITADGHLTPCCCAVSPEHYGNVRTDDDRDWDTIRSDAGVMKWVGSFVNADPPICEGCTLNPNQSKRVKTNVTG